jgi:hypothetical protein
MIEDGELEPTGYRVEVPVYVILQISLVPFRQIQIFPSLLIDNP